MGVADVRFTTGQEKESFKEKQFGKGINAPWQIDGISAADIHPIPDDDATRRWQKSVIKEIRVCRRLQKGCFVGANLAIKVSIKSLMTLSRNAGVKDKHELVY